MPILDKKALMADLEKRMDEYVPGKTSRAVLHDLSEILDGYDVITSAPVSKDSDNSAELINLYLNAKAVEGLSAKTIESYRYDLFRLLRDIGVPIKRMTVDHIRSYIASELERGVKKNTIKNREQRYATFFKWLKNEDLIDRIIHRHIKIFDPFRGIRLMLYGCVDRNIYLVSKTLGLLFNSRCCICGRLIRRDSCAFFFLRFIRCICNNAFYSTCCSGCIRHPKWILFNLCLVKIFCYNTTDFFGITGNFNS